MTKFYIIAVTLVILTLASSAGRPVDAFALTATSQPATVLGDVLAWARTDDPVFRYLVVAKIQSVVQTTEYTGTLADYAAAAEIVGLREYDPALNSQLYRWLRTQTIKGDSGNTPTRGP